MRNFIIAAVASIALFGAPVMANAQASGGGCGLSGFPCYSHQLGNPVTPTDHSGAIAIGGTAQQALSANPNRSYCEIQNLSTGDEWINETGTASAGPGSWWIPAGSDRPCSPIAVPTGAVSVFGSTTGQGFTLKTVP